MMAKARQAREGGSWHVQVSLAQTGRWLWNSAGSPTASKPVIYGGGGDALYRGGRFRLRRVAGGQAFRDLVENPGILGPSGDAARQPPAAMAGTRIGIQVTVELAYTNFNLTRQRHLHF